MRLSPSSHKRGEGGCHRAPPTAGEPERQQRCTENSKSIRLGELGGEPHIRSNCRIESGNTVPSPSKNDVPIHQIARIGLQSCAGPCGITHMINVADRKRDGTTVYTFGIRAGEIWRIIERAYQSIKRT